MEDLAQNASVAGLIFTLIFALLALFIARRCGYFWLPPKLGHHKVTFLQVLGVFATYLFLTLFLLPFLFAFVAHSYSDTPTISEEWMNGGLIAFQFILFLVLLGFCFIIKKETRLDIFWRGQLEHKRVFSKAILMGVLTLLISYPVILFINSATGFISVLIWGKSGVEQVAVLRVKETLDEPFLFAFMIIGVVFLVPFMEELLFRGFLQSYLRRYLGRGGSLCLTAAIFSLVHYSDKQSIGNFQLIISLFVLSLFLGFIYERERTLWAPITLHAAFNLSGAVLIFVNHFFA